MSGIRDWFIRISHSVKLSYYCRQLGIKQSNLTMFLKGYDNAVSFDRLITLRDLIISDLSEITG